VNVSVSRELADTAVKDTRGDQSREGGQTEAIPRKNTGRRPGCVEGAVVTGSVRKRICYRENPKRISKAERELAAALGRPSRKSPANARHRRRETTNEYDQEDTGTLADSLAAWGRAEMLPPKASKRRRLGVTKFQRCGDRSVCGRPNEGKAIKN